MITSLDTTNPREIGILCEYTHAIVWAEYFIQQSNLLAQYEPANPHLEVLDDLVNLYYDQADRFVAHISTDIMVILTRAAMDGEITVSEAMYVQREGFAAFKRANIVIWDI